ncbi:MAG: chalcone isomerase family protein [Desulfococcaceae bacterium]
MRKFAVAFSGLLTLFALLTAGPAAALEIGGVALPDTLTAGTEELTLNGAGLRKKFFVKVYAGGLYLTEPSVNADAVVAADAPMAIRLHFIYDGVSSEKLVAAWKEGFAAATDGNTAPIQPGIDKFNGFFNREAKAGDTFDILYTPEQGVRVYRGDRLQGVISGLDFKRALFAIWLGAEPADEDLKEGMLGQ